MRLACRACAAYFFDSCASRIDLLATSAVGKGEDKKDGSKSGEKRTEQKGHGNHEGSDNAQADSC